MELLSAIVIAGVFVTGWILGYYDIPRINAEKLFGTQDDTNNTTSKGSENN